MLETSIVTLYVQVVQGLCDRPCRMCKLSRGYVIGLAGVCLSENNSTRLLLQNALVQVETLVTRALPIVWFISYDIVISNSVTSLVYSIVDSKANC